MKKDETIIQEKIIAHLKEHKVLNWRMSGATNLSGFPDILVCYKGFFVGLEVKTDVGTPTLQQAKVIQDIIQSGGVAGLVTSVKDVEDLLSGVDKWYEKVNK